jgi:hypothetical protein
MSWDNGTIGGLLAVEQYKLGRIGPEPLQGLVGAARHNQASQDQLVPREVSTAATGTAVVLVTGAGRLFKMRVENLTTDIIFVVIADNVAAQTICAGRAPARVSSSVPSVCEVTCYEDPHVVGVAFSTSLRVRAFILDGTGTTTAASGVTVKLLVG